MVTDIEKEQNVPSSVMSEIVTDGTLTEDGSGCLAGWEQREKYTESECCWEAGWRLVGCTSVRETSRWLFVNKLKTAVSIRRAFHWVKPGVCYNAVYQPWELSSPQCQHCQIARWGSSASLSLCTFQWWSGHWVSHRTPPLHMHQDYKVRETRQGWRGVILYIRSNITIHVWLIKPLSRVLQETNYCINKALQHLSSGPLNMKNMIFQSCLLLGRY